MPDIVNAITYTKEIQTIIAKKLKDPSFEPSEWNSDELLPVRRYIRNYYRRAQNFKCAYCKKSVSMQSVDNAHIEHILAKSRNRSFIFEPRNLCVVCADCNVIKRSKEIEGKHEDVLKKTTKRYPKTSKAFRIVHPHFDNYYDHIVICGDFYLDRTEKGSFTIMACRLNRKLHASGLEALLSNSELFPLMEGILNETDPLKQATLILQLRGRLFSI